MSVVDSDWKGEITTKSPSSWPIFPQGLGHDSHFVPRGAGISLLRSASTMKFRINGGTIVCTDCRVSLLPDNNASSSSSVLPLRNAVENPF